MSTRNELIEAFQADVLIAWKKHGLTMLKSLEAKDLHNFVKLAAALEPVDSKKTMSHEDWLKVLDPEPPFTQPVTGVRWNRRRARTRSLPSHRASSWAALAEVQALLNQHPPSENFDTLQDYRPDAPLGAIVRV
jgi:hypothetical protein